MGGRLCFSATLFMRLCIQYAAAHIVCKTVFVFKYQGGMRTLFVIKILYYQKINLSEVDSFGNGKTFFCLCKIAFQDFRPGVFKLCSFSHYLSGQKQCEGAQSLNGTKAYKIPVIFCLAVPGGFYPN